MSGKVRLVSQPSALSTLRDFLMSERQLSNCVGSFKVVLLSSALQAVQTELFRNNFPTSGEKLEREEVDILIKECCDPEDDDGFIPYERKF